MNERQEKKSRTTKPDYVKLVNDDSGNVYYLSGIPLGSGGNGSVFVGYTDPDDETTKVAIKYYKSDVEEYGIRSEYVIQEFLTKRKVDGLCKVLDSPIYVPNVGWYLVIEYISGRPMTNLIKATRKQVWKMDEALEMTRTFIRLMKRLAEIVGNLGRNCVVHYDIKPLNVMITFPTEEKEEDVVLIDYGLSCFKDHCVPEEGNRLSRAEREFMCTEYSSTPGYNPPEIKEGVPSDYDFSNVDTYMMGKLFADLITGIFTYERPSDFEKTLKRSKLLPKEYRTNNVQLDILLEEMIVDDYDNRPSMEQVIDVLNHIKHLEPFPIFEYSKP